jgi:anaerobic dimethyl sulfoxide reductase subunit C (anchor subunit)
MHPEWPLILFTFFLCVAGGAFGAQGMLTVVGKGRKMQLASLITALAALIVGGVAVFMHLQHWERIFNGFGHITSGITLELIGCVVFGVALVLYFLMMRRSEDSVAPKWCGIMAIAVSLALPTVTGMSYLMPSRPSWDTPLLVVFYLTNTVFMGALIALILTGLTKSDGTRDISVKLGLVGGLLQMAVVFIYAFVINGSTDLYSADISYYFDPTLPDVAMVDATSLMQSIFTGSQAVMFWVGVVVVGVVVALALLCLSKQLDGKKLASAAGAALVCTAVGSICWRVILYVVAISVFALY